jgi:hypothetical protein
VNIRVKESISKGGRSKVEMSLTVIAFYRPISSMSEHSFRASEISITISRASSSPVAVFKYRNVKMREFCVERGSVHFPWSGVCLSTVDAGRECVHACFIAVADFVNCL